jgi:hypothetical protein
MKLLFDYFFEPNPLRGLFAKRGDLLSKKITVVA